MGAESMSNQTAEERRSVILQMLTEHGGVKVQDLCEIFQVSEVTIRRDLEILESKNLITRIRGGAVQQASPALETLFLDRLSLQREAKKSIAACAADIVDDGNVVILSAGSTTTFIARELRKKKELTVVTTAINIASELAGLEHITLVVVGGIVRPGSYAMVGHMAEDALHSLNADIAFVGVDGIDIRTGFTTPNLMEAHVDKVMLQRARKKVIVADSSKFRRFALSPVVGIHDVDLLITDAEGDTEYIDQLKRSGLEIRTC